MHQSNSKEHKSIPKIIVREKKMVDAMAEIYCQDHHRSNNLFCEKCNELREYSKDRLDNCRYQENKPVCGICGLKCYNPKFKNEAERMFTYSGPRMFFKHPLLSLPHILDGLRNNGGTRQKKNDY